MRGNRPRTLILIVAYNAEGTLRTVLDRIPAEVLREYDCEVLVIDDASSDATFRAGLEYRQSRPDLPITVLRNPHNQGYGGNQKIGYAYAISEGFELVALVHGDGQYAPEDLPRLLRPLRDESADAVFGSRMLDRGSARKGGMPLYKYVGNRVLTATQNWLSQARLSEWHSGYRLYRVATLRRMRFEANHDDFAFDTDIILQLLNAQARILELPIPTFYGDEICRVNGIRYAAQVVVASLHNALHRVGLFQRRAFEPIAAAAPSGRDAKLGYRSSHSEVLSRIAPGSRVLDVGSVPGAFASALADKGAVVSTAHHEFTEVHDSRISSHVVDLGHALGLPLHDVDQVLMLDVVEHLAEPEAFIEGLRYALGDRPRELVLTTPNIAFFVTRLMLLAGQFNYGGSGVLDRTHTRLFTFRTIQSLLRDAGFQVVEITGIPAPFPKAVRNPLVARVLLGVNRALIAIAPRVFSYQILVRATSRPHVDHLLSRTRSSTAELTA